MASRGEHEAEDQSKAKVFISYSRKDMAFADRLETALEERGFEPLMDRTDIYAFEEWWKRIEALIVGADTVVFVLSPDAVASDVALREVSFAASLSWIRQHTKFGEEARHWVLAKKASGLLLRSPALEEAEHWIASRPKDAPTPTEETQAFIRHSRQATSRRRNTLTGALAAGMLLALSLAGVAYWQRALAVDNEQRALEARNQALMTQSRFLADLSVQRSSEGDAGTAMLFALEALPITRERGQDRPYTPEAEAALFESSQGLLETAVLVSNTGRLKRKIQREWAAYVNAFSGTDLESR